MTSDNWSGRTAAPGWYQDPSQPGALRYFDGAQWTAHTAPVPAAMPPAPWNQQAYAPATAAAGADPQDPMHWVLPTGRTPQSIAAGYLGLFSLVIFPLAPFAIGFGVWALARSEQTGLRGRGRAIFGIVAGAAGAGFWIWYLASGGMS